MLQYATHSQEAGTLWQVFDRFCQIDLHPDRVSNTEMGYLFEELIRRFSEISNETAGEHFTPREVIRLIVELLIANDDTKLSGKGIIRQDLRPAVGVAHVALSADRLCQQDLVLPGRHPVAALGLRLRPEPEDPAGRSPSGSVGAGTAAADREMI